MSRRIISILIGFILGFFMLHPVSMVFQGLIHPEVNFRLARFMDAFSVHHLPMAFFFGALGALFGYMNTEYTLALSSERQRVSMLESLLPICAHCKKIRDDSGKKKGEGKWIRVDHYISSKTDTEFTHGMCPDCYQDMLKELEEEDFREIVSGEERSGI